MTSLDKDGVRVAGLGKQAQSSRRSAPSFTVSRVGRDARERMYITEDHIRTQRLGRESPIMGPVYEVKSTLGGTSAGFGCAPKMVDLPGHHKDDPGDLSTNDALQAQVDSQPFKYKREPEILIGTDPRGKLKDVTLIRNHSAAFFGRESPGPAAVGGEGGPGYECTKPRLAPPQFFGQKLKLKKDWTNVAGASPGEVGPGRYERRDLSLGKQHLTQRKNQTVNAFTHAAKFPKTRNADSISQLDAARSCLGKQCLGKNRSEPSINFAADTRATKAKTMLCMTRQDMGPKAFMPKPVFSMPNLPSERAVMSSGIG